VSNPDSLKKEVVRNPCSRKEVLDFYLTTPHNLPSLAVSSHYAAPE